MTEQFATSMIHPRAPEFLSLTCLYRAPIDVEAALARLTPLWNLAVKPEWDEVRLASPDSSAAGVDSLGASTTNSGRILHFVHEGILAMFTAVNMPALPERGQLPEHSFHVAVTCFVTPEARSVEKSKVGQAQESRPEDLDAQADARRRGMLTAHTIMTQILDALMREEASVGVFRHEFGVVQPPQMIIELADSLAHGQAPLPLWVAVRTAQPDLSHGRTFGLPLFGHLDLEITESTKSQEELYALLAGTADYIISSGVRLLPGQTIGSRGGDQIALSQTVSQVDSEPVLRIHV